VNKAVIAVSLQQSSNEGCGRNTNHMEGLNTDREELGLKPESHLELDERNGRRPREAAR
jgi:hypothetical protein